ncbi:hypothetical protein [Actinoplanes sp. NPDC051859]|uniref:hypothetical protein n=1 Tax=Actinoplanes sp. NPDC051859 TaxID=3363909 RepID=UPI0037A66014
MKANSTVTATATHDDPDAAGQAPPGRRRQPEDIQDFRPGRTSRLLASADTIRKSSRQRR